MVGGKVNVRKANAILNDSTTTGENIASELSAARKRKLLAQAKILRDEVEGLRANVVEKEVAEECWNTETSRVRETVMRIADEVEFPSDLAGHPNAIFSIIDDKVREVLNRLAEPDEAPASDAPPPASPNLSAPTAVELATLSNNLKADRLEIEALLQSGEAVRLDAFAARFDDAALRGSLFSRGSCRPPKRQRACRKPTVWITRSSVEYLV